MYEFLINQGYERAPVLGEPAFAISGADSQGLHIREYGTELVRPWTAVQSVHALSRAPAVADKLTLVVTFSDRRVALVSDDEAHWYTLALTLPQRLSGVPSYSEWSMRLRANPQETLQLF